ncbi:DoxX-like family protein [Kaistella sp.]|uniref:DoxX-like family protein n=1 Tax=Kaistella sp. TaxID=2782235 RepID=UPI003C6A0FEA
MNKIKFYNFLNYFFCLVWLVNGLFCKILNFEPRHQEIVGRILGTENSGMFTLIIGVLEILMAIWIFSKLKAKLNSWLQMIIILTMNIIEFSVVPDLLLWGKLNLIFAFLFVTLIYYKEFILKKHIENVSIS